MTAASSEASRFQETRKPLSRLAKQEESGWPRNTPALEIPPAFYELIGEIREIVVNYYPRSLQDHVEDLANEVWCVAASDWSGPEKGTNPTREPGGVA